MMGHTTGAHDDETMPVARPIDTVPAYAPVSEFEALYASRYAAMVRLAYFLTGSLGQAEEATQECFARLYERWPTVDDHAAYLRASVVNRCRSWHRSRLATRRREARVDRVADHVDRPDELRDALAKLPRRRREVIVLRFYEGLAIADIALVLGISEGTVKSTLHHGLNELKGVLP